MTVLKHAAPSTAKPTKIKQLPAPIFIMTSPHFSVSGNKALIRDHWQQKTKKARHTVLFCNMN